jgi:hypothetical protein
LPEYGERTVGVAATVTSTAQDVASSVAKTVGTAATSAQEMAGAAAIAVTDTVAGAGTYLQEKGVQVLQNVRRHRTASL